MVINVVLNEGLKPIGYRINDKLVSFDGLKDTKVDGHTIIKSQYDHSLRVGNKGDVLKTSFIINKGNNFTPPISTPIMLVERYIDDNNAVLGYLVDIGGNKAKLNILDIVKLSEVALGTGNYYVSQKAGKHYLVSKGKGIKINELPTKVVASSDDNTNTSGRQQGIHIGDNKNKNKDTKYSIFDLCNTLAPLGGVLVKVKGSSYKTIGERKSEVGSRFISKGIEIAKPYLTPSHKGLNVNISFKQLGSLNTKGEIDGVNVVDTFVYKTRSIITGDLYNFANDDRADLYVCIPKTEQGNLQSRIQGTDLPLMLEASDNVLIGTTVQAEGYVDGDVLVYGLKTSGLYGVDLTNGISNIDSKGSIKLRSDLAYIRKKLKAVVKQLEKEDVENHQTELVYAAHLDKYDKNTLVKLSELGLDLKSGAYIETNSYAKVGKEVVAADLNKLTSLEWTYTGVLTDKTSQVETYKNNVLDILKGMKEVSDLRVYANALDGKGLGKVTLQTFGVIDKSNCLGVYDRNENNITNLFKKLLAILIKQELSWEYTDVHKRVRIENSNKVSDIYLGIILGIIEFLKGLRLSISNIVVVVKGVITSLDTAINILDYDLCVLNTYISKQNDYFIVNKWEDITSSRQKTGKKYQLGEIVVVAK